MNFIGIDIGGTKCAVILGDENVNIIKKVSFPTVDVNATLDRIYSEVAAMLNDTPCAAIGISCGGPLDEKKGVILSPPNLPLWDNIHITDELYARFNIPAYLCNDANACAIAEWRFGAGRGTENMVFFTFGTGLGAGLIIDGKLYSGTSGMAGEAGHIRLANDGPVGYGKAGSFEGFCSGGGIATLGKTEAKKALASGKVLSFCKSEDQIGSITTKLIAECANSGHKDAIKIFRSSAKKLGQGLAIVIDLLNPQAIVIGSVYARCESLFRKEMMKVIEKEALYECHSVCKILPASLGDAIGDVAALSVAINGFSTK